MSFAPPVHVTSRMTSPFGVRPSRRTGAPSFHAGVDFLASTGDPVYAVAPATVRVFRPDSLRAGSPTFGYGNVLGLDHGDGTWSIYAHLSRVLVAEGDMVTVGSQIAEAGSTSNRKFPGMGAHLHFEIRVSDGTRTPFPGPYRRFNVDPQAWLLERGITIEGGIAVREPGGASLSGTPALVPTGPEELGLPDEPVRMASSFNPPSPLVVAGIAGLGLVAAGGAAGLIAGAVGVLR